MRDGEHALPVRDLLVAAEALAALNLQRTRHVTHVPEEEPRPSVAPIEVSRPAPETAVLT